MALSKGIRAGRAFVELFADDSKLVAGLNRAAARLKAFGASVSAVGMKLATLGGAALAPMLGAAKMFGSAGDDLAKMSQRTGASVEALSQLAYAAAMADVDTDGLDKGLRKMQKFLDAAATGSAEARESLARLGLTAANLAGLAPDKQFELLADRLDKVADPAAKAALAMKIFGREGTSLIPLMAGGAAGIEALRKRAGELGLTISTQAAAGAMKFHDALKTLWAVVRRAGFAIGESLAPVLQKLAEDMTGAIVQANAFIQNNRQLVATALKVAAEITRNARGQRRRSVPDRDNAPSRAYGRGLRRCPECSVMAWDAGNPLVETPKPGTIVNIADGGRQRAVIWQMSA